MANFFDQFDAAPQEAAPRTNFFDQFDSFDERFSAVGEPTGSPELKTALRERQSPRERGRSTAMERGGRFDAAMSAVSEGGVGNLPDYPQAVGSGIVGAVTGKGFSGPYAESLEEQRGQREGLAEKYPGTTLGGTIGGAVAGGVGPSMAIKAPTVLGRILQSALVGGGVGGFQGAASGEGTEGRLKGGATGAAFGAPLGAGGEAVISGVGKGVQRYLGAATRPAPGVVPAERITAAEEFGVPLTRGQATGNVDQQAYEEAARNAARGRAAGHAVRGFDEQQRTAIKGAQEGISESLGGAPAAIPETGEAVGAALKGKAAGLKSQADEAYTRAAAKDASIASDEITKLGQKVATQLEGEGIRLDTYGNYPGAQSAMNLLRRVSGFEGASSEGAVVAQSLEGLEQARKGLLKVKGANAEDWRALKAIRNSFDDWISDAMDKKLFSGDPTALDDLKQARALWRDYKGLTTKGKGDATPIVAKIVNEERTGDEVANWMLGTAGAGQAGRSARIAVEVRNVIGKDAPEWEALRQAAWTKMTNPARGDGGAQAVSKSIQEFTSGQGAPLAKVLFSSEELTNMQKLVNVMKLTVADKRATNPSKSSYGIARLIGSGGALGGGGAGYWMTGDPHFIALAAAPLIKGTAGLSKGIAATRATPSVLSLGIGSGARAGVAAGAGYGGN